MSDSASPMAAGQPNAGPNGFRDASETFTKLQDLLKAKDDTSRFVGLALLKTVLDNGQLAQNPQKIRTLWEALSPKFLDRLLRAHSNEKIGKAEARDMVDLATTILHTFSILLPDESRHEKRLFGRILPLVKALLESPPETTRLILQTLLTVVSQPEGAVELLHIEDITPLTEIAPQYPHVLDIINFMWINASTIDSEVQTVRESIDRTMPILLSVFDSTDAVTLIRFAGDFLSKVLPSALPHDPKWLGRLILSLRKVVVGRPTQVGRAAYTQLAATLLQSYPIQSHTLLFRDDTVFDQDKKSFSNLFINLLLIDIRSSIPSLLAKLNNSEYPPLSRRLAAAFDVTSSFIGFLVKSLDDESDTFIFSMPPDMLLKLRKDIAETLSLTIEYLRDRWDASIAGALGLHPSARAGESSTSEGTRRTLTWDSMKDTANTDPLILASVRMLSIWIREDENESLRRESAGIMDMLIELYKTSSPDALDFRYPILMALEVILTTEDGLDAFLEQDGWIALAQDLATIFQGISNEDLVSCSSEASRGLEIVRVLLAVIDHPSTPFPEENWMVVAKSTTSMKPASNNSPPIIIEFQIAMLQLSTALLSKAAGGMQKRFVTTNPALRGITKQLEKTVMGMVDKIEAGDLMSLLEDVALDLENLAL